jgi:uncharacterized damage-inducible protein DinB
MLAEIQQYLDMIEDLREQVCNLVAGVPADALNWRPIEGDDDHATNSLAIMAAHVAGAEHFWIAEVVGQWPATRDRSSEFVLKAADAQALIDRLNESSAETREILPALTIDDLHSTRQVGGRMVSVRWAILHVIDHTALHLGHMQLTYQLWHSGQIGPSPRWFERLSDNE